MVEIKCIIASIIFNNPLNGYSIISTKEKESGRVMTMVFPHGFASPQLGLNLIVKGDWVVNNKYGKQFMVEEYSETEPDSEEGAIAYLSCGIFKGIGPAFAARIVNYFGDKVFEVIEKTPERLYEVKGIGKAKIDNLLDQWEEHQTIRNVVCELSPYGLSINIIMKIYKYYGGESVRVIKENPYRLCEEVYGIGFTRADEIAMKLGIDKEDSNRIFSCLEFVLRSATDEGHTYLPTDELISQAIELLDIDYGLVLGGLNEMIDMGNEGLIKICDNVFLPSIYHAEKNIADKINELYQFKPYKSGLFDVSIEEIESVIGVKYNEAQIKAINAAIDNNVFVLTGGPGTGKTTALRGLIYILKEKFGYEIACAAPTGRAAKRMSEVTGMEATTIHRLLAYNPQIGFQYNEDNPLFQEVIIIDEASMINVLLMNCLLAAIKKGTKLIIVGDENQLPCIGPGNILHDIIEADTVPVVTLKEIFRQAEGSKIITNAHNIVNEKPLVINNSLPDNDFFFINENNPDKLIETITQLVTKRLPTKYNVKPTDIQVLTPRRKDARACAIELNKTLQEAINPNSVSISCNGYQFRPQDKVMQIKNNYEKNVFNGDIGFVTEVNVGDKTLKVDYGDGFIVPYDITDLDELVLAYACTIHKSQGSEYPIVVIPMLCSFGIMLKRNLIYTGITRAKDICVIIGEQQAIIISCKDNTYKKRNTMLKDWLTLNFN